MAMPRTFAKKMRGDKSFYLCCCGGGLAALFLIGPADAGLIAGLELAFGDSHDEFA